MPGDGFGRLAIPLSKGAGSLTSAGKAANRRPGTLARSNARISERLQIVLADSPTTARPMLKMPGVYSVNNSRGATFEPGGQYEIRGRGFGDRSGTLFMRFAGETVHFRIDHWSDQLLYVGLTDDISGVPDSGDVDLVVGVSRGEAIHSRRFDFRAARAEVSIPPPVSSFSFDRGTMHTVFSQTFWSSRGPDALEDDGEYLNVRRSTYDEDPDTPCFPSGFDLIRWNIPLNPGFEVVSYEWYHAGLTNGSGFQKIGAYAARWDGDNIRIDYGVHRFRTGPFLWRVTDVLCGSSYKIKLWVSGPRGLPPV